MSKTKLYIATAVSDMTGALFGYSVGFIGGVLVLPSFLQHFHLDTLPSTELARAQSSIVSAWIVGAFFGVPSSIPICSRYGRKSCLMFSAFMYVVGTVLQVINAGSSVSLFEVGRLLNGFGVGAGTLVSPLFIAEISTNTDRGMLLSSYQVVIQACALLGFWGAFASNAIVEDTSDLQWQIPVAVQLVPGAILLLGALYIEESPHHVAATGTLDQVERTVAWFRGRPATDATVKREARDISTTVLSGMRRQAIRQTSFLHEAFHNPIRKRLAVGVGLFIAQNFTGMNALNYYVPVIFMTAGFKSVSASLFLTGIFGAVKLLSAALFMFVCVRVYGNRFWLLWGTCICAISMFVLGYCISTIPKSSDPGSDVSNITVRAALSVLSVNIFSLAFGVSIGPISWNVCSEIFPSYVNAECFAVTTCTQWLFQFVIAAVTPILLAAIGPMTFVFFGVCNIAAMVFSWLCVPETRGVALGKDMSAVFGQDVKEEEECVEVEEVEDIDEETPLLTSQRSRRRSSIAIVV